MALHNDSEFDTMTDNDHMDTDHEIPNTSESRSKTVSWSTDIGVASLSKDLFCHLQKYKEKATDVGEDEPDLPVYENPKDQITTKTKLNQRIRFNLIHHRGTVADIPAIKLFKLFTSTLKKVDPSINILPFHSSKQHYSSLITKKQI